MVWFRAFVAGFASTLVFHQGVLALFHLAGLVPRPAWGMDPVPPFGVPAVLSLAFFGGLWGIVLWALIRGVRGRRHWLLALVAGAVLPTAVALFVVFPLKGMPLAAGWDPKIWAGAFILNGAWGIGVALGMRMLGGSPRR